MHKSQKLVPHKGVGVQIPPSAPNFLAILAVTTKGGDDRRPFRSFWGTFEALFPNYSVHSDHLRLLSRVVRGLLSRLLQRFLPFQRFKRVSSRCHRPTACRRPCQGSTDGCAWTAVILPVEGTWFHNGMSSRLATRAAAAKP